MEEKVVRKQNGITLVALTITIVILLILAGVSLTMIIGDYGIFNNATAAKEETGRKKVIDAVQTETVSKLSGKYDGKLTREEFKEVLDNYFVEVPNDYNMSTQLITKSEYGTFTVEVSELRVGNIEIE